MEQHRQDDEDVVVVDDDKTDSSAVYNTEWSKEATPLSFVVRAHSVNDDEEEKLWTVLLFQNWRLSMIYCQQVIIWGVLTYSEFCLNTIHSLPNGKVKGVGRFSHLALKEKKRYACFVYLFLYFTTQHEEEDEFFCAPQWPIWIIVLLWPDDDAEEEEATDE